MRRHVRLVAALLGVLVLAAAAQADPIDDLKLGRNIAAAEQALVDRGRAAVPALAQVVAVETDVGRRVRAARVLALIAERTTDPALTEALHACFRDSSAGVRYWGLRGLTAEPQPAAAAAEALRRGLRPQESATVQMLAVEQVARRRVQAAAPELVALLEARAGRYREERKAILAQPLREVEPGVGLAPDAPDPTRPTIPGAPEPPAGPVVIPGVSTIPGVDAPERPDEPAPTEEVVLGELSRPERQLLMERFDESAATADVRRIGLALQAVTGEEFGFAEAFPWDLQKPMDRALGWSRAR